MPSSSPYQTFWGNFLLGTFVLGGLLAPAVHEAQHGMEWAAEKALADHCDHAAHGPGVEDHHAVVSLDLCLFCFHRWNTYIAFFPKIQPLKFQTRSYAVRENRGSSVQPFSFSARAPPSGT